MGETKYPPYMEYITVIKEVCDKLRPQDVEELRSDIIKVLKRYNPNKTSAK